MDDLPSCKYDLNVTRETPLWELSTQLLAELGRMLFYLLCCVDRKSSGKYILQLSLIECEKTKREKNFVPSQTLEVLKDTLDYCEEQCPRKD